MKTSIYLREITLKDTSTSYKWRNNPVIWKYSKFRPAKPITHQDEKEWWLRNQKKTDECRLAICIRETNEYIGNIQVVEIVNGKGIMHLFIGEEKHWGKGYGKVASILLLDHVFEELNLREICLEVHQDNVAAISIYKKFGFVETLEFSGDFVWMTLKRQDYYSHKAQYEKVAIAS